MSVAQEIKITMTTKRVDRLLDAYFHRPVEEYLDVCLSIKETGGLNSNEIITIKTQVPYVHAQTIIRHVTII